MFGKKGSGDMKIQTLLKEEILSMKRAIAVYFLVLSGTLLLQLLVPYVSGAYIDSLEREQPMILAFIGVMAFLDVFSALLEYGMAYLMTRLDNTFLYKICNRMFQKIYDASLSFSQSRDAAFLTDQITGDAAVVTGFVLNSLPDIAYDMVLLSVSTLFIFHVDLLLGSLITLTIPIYLFIYWRSEKRMYENEYRYKEAENAHTAKGMEQICCVRSVKENGVSKEMEERFARSFRRMLKSAVDQVKTQYLFSDMNQLIMVSCYLFTMGIGGHNVVIGRISIGSFTIINTYVDMMLSTAIDIIDLFGSYPKVKVAADRMDALLTECRKVSPYDERAESLGENGISSLRLEDISFSFGERYLFRRLSAEFKKGRIYGIVGENGSGKSTLLDVMLGLYPGDHEGEIFYNGINIRDLSSDEIVRLNVAFLGQHTQRIDISPKGYLRFGVDGYDPDREKRLIRYFWGDQELDIGEEGSIAQCSGGEMQKLELIRVFQKDRTLTILDEPTNGSDAETVQRLIHLIEQAKKDHIFIIVSHDKKILDICDEKIELGRSECV